MGSPTIFNGAFTKLLTARGIIRSTGELIENDGDKNYIRNHHAEVNVTGWATYADAAGTTPVDGTGGSPTVTITRTTSSPLRGLGSFLLTKDAANRQGEGVSYAFTIDSADTLKNLSISFDYSGSANFVSGDAADVGIYIYDVTNATVIFPTTINIQASSGKFQAIFASTSSTSYRLIFHVQTTNASAWTFKFDGVSVGPNNLTMGPSMGDWQSYTLTVTAATANPTKGGTITRDEARWRRVGDSMEIHWDYAQTAGGTAGTGQYFFSIPPGYTIDTAKISAVNAAAQGAVGPAIANDGTDDFVGTVMTRDSTTLWLRMSDETTGPTTVSSTFNALSNATQRYSFLALIPISGWSSNISVNNTGTFSMSSILANGTRVTAAPAALGEYRSRSKTTATSNTFADAAPTTPPSATNGLRFHAANYNDAQTSGLISLYDVFIGKGKYLRGTVYSAAAFTGQVLFDYAVESATVANGTRFAYDQSTGVLTIEAGLNITSNTSRGIGISTAAAQITDGYVDILVSDNVIAVGNEPFRNELVLVGGTGYGSTDTKIRRFTTEVKNVGFTYTNTAANGTTVTIPNSGLYWVVWQDRFNAAGWVGVTRNADGTERTTNVYDLTSNTTRLAASTTAEANFAVQASVLAVLTKGDFIRPHGDGATTTASADQTMFRIVQVNY